MPTFTGRATPTKKAKSKKIVAAVDAYESDFGTVKVVPNRSQRAPTCWCSRWISGRSPIRPYADFESLGIV